jgi:S1-C subfamily serine protease
MCLILLVSVLVTLPSVPFGVARAFSQLTYMDDLSLPAVVLIHTRIDYAGTFYIPWRTGAEAFAVTGHVGTVGSGFFVNPNGYIVTNGHVVFCLENKDYRQDPMTKKDIMQDAIKKLTTLYQRQHGVTFMESDIQYIVNYNMQYGEVNESQRYVYVVLGESEGDVIEAERGFAATVVNSDPFIGRDLAILKVELSNTPSLLLGDSDKVEVGDTVYAVGYTDVRAFHPSLSDSTLLAPSLSQGAAIGMRMTRQNIPAIQHSATTTFGNSGGPLLDAGGNVVGVIEVGGITDLGLEAAVSDFAVASNVVRDFLRENGVDNSAGDVTVHYWRGLALYYGSMYASAKGEFDAVTALCPNNGRAEQLSQECQSAILSGERAESSVALKAFPLAVKARRESVTVTGYLEHISPMPLKFNITWPVVQIVVQYTKPDGSSVIHTISNSADGTFTDSIKPDAPGQWSVRASWQGDEDHLGASSDTLAFTVTEPPLFEMLVDTGLVFVFPIVAIMAIAAIVLSLRKHKANSSQLTPLPIQGA